MGIEDFYRIVLENKKNYPGMGLKKFQRGLGGKKNKDFRIDLNWDLGNWDLIRN